MTTHITSDNLELRAYRFALPDSPVGIGDRNSDSEGLWTRV